MKKLFVFISMILFVLTSCGKKEIPSDAHDHEKGESVSAQSHDGENEPAKAKNGLKASDKEDPPSLVEHDHEHEAGTTHEDEAELQELKISPSLQKKWGIEVGSPGLQNISSQIFLPGILHLNKDRTATVSSMISGKAIKVLAGLGKNVKKGESLLLLNSLEFSRTQADLLKTKARLDLSRTEYRRTKILFTKKAIEQKAFLRKEAEYLELISEYGALKSKLNSLGISSSQIEKLIQDFKEKEGAINTGKIASPYLAIRSPLSGRVILRNVILGDYVEPQKILFTVSDLTSLWAELEAHEKDLPFINLKSEIVIISSLFPEVQFEGKLSHINDMVDEELRTVKIRIDVINPSFKLKPNMYIKGKITNKISKGSLIYVPERAIQNLDGKKIVFIQEGDDLFHIRPVTLGNKIGNRVIILEGLSLHDKVVIKGGFALKTEISKGTFGQAHVH